MAARLHYSAIASLDGYTADAEGNFEWAAPDAEVHAFANELEGAVGTQLFGRRMYEVMRSWDTVVDNDLPTVEREFAERWRNADKVVYSSTLESVDAPRTRLERNFDAAAVSEMKALATRDLSIGGANLAAHAFAARLVDECHLFLHPVIIGGGTPGLPRDQRMNLELVEEFRLASGVVYLRYRCA